MCGHVVIWSCQCISNVFGFLLPGKIWLAGGDMYRQCRL
jgi:hypothetical protein